MVTLPATEPSADEGSETWAVKSRYLLPERTRSIERARSMKCHMHNRTWKVYIMRARLHIGGYAHFYGRIRLVVMSAL